MKIQNIFWLSISTLATVGSIGATTVKGSGGAVEYTSRGLQSVLEVTKTVGEGVKNVGKSLEEEFQNLNNFSTNCLRDEQYQAYTNYDFSSKTEEVENDWILVN